ncbi:fimbrial protein [Escherichia coli]|nr:fimbrial protein [Escherichia coli]
MKKSIIASVIALGLVSGLAQAANNEVQFHGTVTTESCDLSPVVNGSLNPNGGSLIELGDVKAEGTGKPVTFAFHPAADQENVKACNAIAGAANKVVEVTWSGSKFESKGLGMLNGAATGSFVQITPVNNTGAKDFIKANNTKHEFSANLLAQGADGLKYSALLQAGSTPGDFQTAATFNMSYK